jgi:hypothetical protein
MTDQITIDSLVSGLKIAIPILSGGLAGSALTNILQARRNRVPVVGYRLDFTTILKPKPDHINQHEYRIVASDGASFPNLFHMKMELVNGGTKDFESLKFGITLAEGDTVISAEWETENRHRSAQTTPTPSGVQPSNQLDFVLTPFTRGDVATLQCFVVAGEHREDPGELSLSSPNAVRFEERIPMRISPTSLRLVSALPGLAPVNRLADLLDDSQRRNEKRSTQRFK